MVFWKNKMKCISSNFLEQSLLLFVYIYLNISVGAEINNCLRIECKCKWKFY